MIEQVAEAIQQKDYQTADQLLKQLMQTEPQNPWVQFYVGRLHEARGRLDVAEKVYRQLLPKAMNSKLISQTRQGIARLEAMRAKQRQQALNRAMAEAGSEEIGLLVLESIPPESKQVAAQEFAKVMQLDPYSARLQLPSRGWRLYRTGVLGELRFYTAALRQADIPCFCASISSLQKLNVFQVKFFESASTQVSVICQSQQGQVGKLTLNWSEISQRVEGSLPLFESVVDVDVRRKLQRKTKTLDYVQFCDLHLPARKTILRLCDHQYNFQQGISLSPEHELSQPIGQTTNRSNWNSLLSFLNQKLPQAPVWSEFATFAETAIDFRQMLEPIESHIDLFRSEATPWDAAFQLYSSLVFLRPRHRVEN